MVNEQGSVITLDAGNTVFLPDPAAVDGNVESDSVRSQMAAPEAVSDRYADPSDTQACVSQCCRRTEKADALNGRSG